VTDAPAALRFLAAANVIVFPFRCFSKIDVFCKKAEFFSIFPKNRRNFSSYCENFGVFFRKLLGNFMFSPNFADSGNSAV